MSKTKVENIDSVDLGNLEITTTLNGGYDSNTPDELKREITLHFTGFDELTGDRFEKFVKEIVAGKLRIKVNTPKSHYLKGNPKVHDAETYAQFLDENDCEFTFHVPDLFVPTDKALTPEEKYEKAVWDMFHDGQIDADKRDQLIEIGVG